MLWSIAACGDRLWLFVIGTNCAFFTFGLLLVLSAATTVSGLLFITFGSLNASSRTLDMKKVVSGSTVVNATGVEVSLLSVVTIAAFLLNGAIPLAVRVAFVVLVFRIRDVSVLLDCLRINVSAASVVVIVAATRRVRCQFRRLENATSDDAFGRSDCLVTSTSVSNVRR